MAKNCSIEFSLGAASMVTLVGNNIIGRNSGDYGIITAGGCSNGKSVATKFGLRDASLAWRHRTSTIF